MKKLIIIPLLLLTINSFCQTVSGYFDNGMPGKKVVLHGLGTTSTYFLNPNDSTLNFDSSKVVTDVTLNITNDSIYVYKGGVFVRAIKVGGSSGGGTAAGSSNYIQYNNAGAFGASQFFTYNPSPTAANGIARGLYINGTLTASAANDTLALVDIANPSFVPGSNIQTRQFALRVGGSLDLYGTYTPQVGAGGTVNTGLYSHRRLSGSTLHGFEIVDTLVPTANNSSLAGVLINPVFPTTGFTGVSQYSLLVQGNTSLGGGGGTTTFQNSTIANTTLQVGSGSNNLMMNQYGPQISYSTSDGNTYVGMAASNGDMVAGSNKNDYIVGLRTNGANFAVASSNGTNGFKLKVFGNTGATVIQNAGTFTEDASSLFTVNSTTRGSDPYPKMTSALRLAIPTPKVGLHVYQTDATEGVYVYKSTGWAFAY